MTLLRGSALLSVLTLLLSACASRQAPPAAPADVPAVAPAPAQTVDAQLAVFEQQQKLRAHRAETEGRWADAALAWQVLALMHPGDAQIGVQLAAVRGQIESRLSERRAAAEAARQRGDLERAAEAYLDLLALDPGSAPPRTRCARSNASATGAARSRAPRACSRREAMPPCRAWRRAAARILRTAATACASTPPCWRARATSTGPSRC